MQFKVETIQKIREMARNPEYANFFQQLSNYDYPTELVEELTEMFMYEMELPQEQLRNFNFALRLAYLAGKADAGKEEAS